MNPIRRIRPEDREAILALLISTEAFQDHELGVAMELVDTSLTKPEQQDYLPFVLEHNGRIVAYACFGRNPMTRFTYDLYWIATRADCMRRGFGRRLLHFVEEEVRRREGRLLVIETSSKESYDGSRSFYERGGHTLAGRLPDFYDVGDDRLIYYKRI
jgi:ribosomal protein S18 acetylase RimI-like enzyme